MKLRDQKWSHQMRLPDVGGQLWKTAMIHGSFTLTGERGRYVCVSWGFRC